MTLVGIILGLIPGFTWLIFYLEEDPHHEPKRLIFRTFMAGAAAAVLAYLVEVFLNSSLKGVGIAPLSVISLIVLGLVEELFKFGAVYLSIKKQRAFEAPIDAMVYMIVGAMGFATVENIGALTGNPVGTALLTNVFEIVTFRLVGATLLHALSSGLVGYYWAKSISHFQNFKYIIGGFALATALHVTFNYLILNYGYVTYPIILLVISGFFVLNDFERLKDKIV